MSFDLTTLGGLLAVAAFWLLGGSFLDRDRNPHRALVAILAVLVGLRYFVWRYAATVEPLRALSAGEHAWGVVVFGMEVLAFVEMGIFLLIMSRKNTRSAEADRYAALGDRPPSVDVFITTFNEGLDVLEKTILGAKHLDYPDFKVWVLDDGRRDWLRDYCARQGVGYLTRPDNAHAKAGNINNGLRHTTGDLVAVFDADVVPFRGFLRRTVGFFLAHEDIGVVQTPQHFFNKDPIQANLYLDKIWPDEQRLFFDAMAPCRDAWNAAFCCGAGSILRRRALDRAGGVPTSSITEDLLTTLVLLTHGYRTVYLNEKLSQGLSAESLRGYFIQRSRWCRGGIQCFFVPEGPLRARGLTPLQRLLFTPYGWLVLPLTRVFILVVPVVYLWTGLAPLHFTTTADVLRYQFPVFLMFTLTTQWFVPKKYVPIVTTAVGIFGAFRLLPVALASIVKPFGEPFRVTPKGAASRITVDWFTLTAIACLLAATLLGLARNLVPELQTLRQKEFFPYALGWSVVNVVMLSIAALICFDAPRKRKEERFAIDEPTTLDGRPAVIADISLGGARVRHDAGRRVADRGAVVSLAVADVREPLRAEVRNSNPRELMAAFTELSEPQREDLIVKLFTGRYSNEIYEVYDTRSVVATILRRAVGDELA